MALPFKSYLQEKSNYKGGKSKEEIDFGDQKVYKLSSNENFLGSSPKALKAIQKHLSSVAEYPDRTDKRLCSALSQHYDHKVLPGQFIPTNSGLANIELITRAFLEEGTACIYSSPAFEPYHEFPKKLGAKAIDVPLIGDQFELDLPGILEAISPKTRLIFLTNPNNPTGTHFPKKQIDTLIEQLPDHVVVVFDEVYFQFADAPDYVRALPYVLAGKNVIAVNSFSKAYGLAGLRIGYSYSTPEIARYLRQLRRPFMINRLGLEAAIAALEDQAFIDRTVHLVHQGKQYLYPRLEAMGLKYWKTQANFILIKPDIPVDDFEQAMVRYGIMVRPIKEMEAIRVTIGNREANDAYLEALERVLGEKFLSMH